MNCSMVHSRVTESNQLSNRNTGINKFQIIAMVLHGSFYINSSAVCTQKWEMVFCLDVGRHRQHAYYTFGSLLY